MWEYVVPEWMTSWKSNSEESKEDNIMLLGWIVTFMLIYAGIS
jgi:hypothetical protein